MSRQRLPRGIRNHNPGNIEKGDPWQGLAPDQGADRRFAVFAGPDWGIRALARVLISYQDRHGLKTCYEIAARWAPAPENDVEAYGAELAQRLGVGLHQPIDVHDYATARALVEAIIRHENGMQPYDSLTLNEGLRLAGLRPPPAAQRAALEEVQPLRRTATMRAGRAAEAAGGLAFLSGVIAAFGEALPLLRDLSQLLRDNAPGLLMALGLAVSLTAAWILYARWRERQEGLS